MEIRRRRPEETAAIAAFLEEHFGSPHQAAHGELMRCEEHDAMLGIAGDGSIAGVATFVARTADEFEMTILSVANQWGGLGTRLVDAVADIARDSGAKTLWLITTNDNLDAMRFYQRRGFRLEAVYPGAVDEARRTLKPGIPETGEYGIPLRDELRFALRLASS